MNGVSCTSMGLKLLGILSKSLGSQPQLGRAEMACLCCNHSFPLQFGCALQEQFWLSGAINSATLCWHQDKKPPWNARLGDAHPAAAWNHNPEACLNSARAKHAHIMILRNPFGHGLSEAEGMSQLWHASSVLSYCWDQQKLGKHGGLQVVLWTSKDGILNNYSHEICSRRSQ